MKIISNKAQCKLCGEIIESTDSTHYLFCKCRAIAVSGGSKSIMRLGHHIDILELSEKDYNI